MEDVRITRKRSGVYGGRSAEQRRSERRHKLITAAMEIWQEQGWAAVTMRGVCARAGLIDRYFYESFADRDVILTAVWDQVRDDTLALLLDSIADKREQPPLVQLRIAIAAFVHNMADNPGQAQIFFGDHAGSPVLQQRREDILHRATDILTAMARPYLVPDVDENTFRMTVLMGIGGFIELITAWHAGIIDADADRVIEHAADIGETLGARFLSDERA